MQDINYHHADDVLKSSQGHSLFVGDVSAAEDVGWLKQNNVKTVITVAVGFNLKYDNTIKQIKYDLQDKKTQNISLYFDMAAYQIEKFLKSHSILVHCGAGVSRSATLVIAYLIKYKNMSFLQALKLVKSKRPQVCPNLGFELQLKAYHKSHGNNKMMQKGRGRQKELPSIIVYHANQKNEAFNRSFHNELSGRGRGSHLMLTKSLKPFEQKEKKELLYLRKMAEFRFGITNMSRWKVSGQENKETFKRPFNF